MAKKGEARVQFIADTSEFTKGITDINKTLGNLRSDLKKCDAELKANGNSFETLSNKQQTLQNVIEQNANKIDLLRKKLDACKETLGENSDEYNKLYRQLNKAETEQVQFERALKDTESALDNFSDDAEKATKSVDKLNDEVDDSKGFMDGFADSFDIAEVSAVGLGTALGNLVSGAISACIEAISEFCQYLWDLPEATREFRTNIAKLNGATKQYGYDTEFVNKKTKELYGYFADDQVAVNAMTNLQGIGLSQEELGETIDAGIAVWTAYGDSIPIESLTESINETSQVGKVTGSLADALNWAGISEDDFNKKLEGCKTTQERAKLVTDTLNGAYGESKKVYDENTESLRTLVEEEYDTLDVQSQLANEIEPYKTAWEELKNTLLLNLVPVLQKLSEWIQDCKKNIEEFSQSPTWQAIKEIGEFIGTIVALHFKQLWDNIQGVVAVFEILWTIIQPVWDLLMEGVTYIYNLINGWLELDTKTTESWNNIDSTIKQGAENIAQAIQNFIDEAKRIFSEGWNMITQEIPMAWDNMKTEISNKWEEIKQDAIDAWDGIKTSLSDAWNGIKITCEEIWNDIKEKLVTIWDNTLGQVIEIDSEAGKKLKECWENNKKVITDKVNEIKSKLSETWNDIKTTISTKFNDIKSSISTAWENIKTKASTAWTDIKSAISTKVGDIKTTISTKFNDIKSSISTAWENIKTKASTTWTDIKTFMGNALSDIKDLLNRFKPSWSIPKPKLPKVTIDIAYKSIGGLNIPYPKFSVNWNALGGIFKKPTIFATPNGLQGVGEAGAKSLAH